MTHWKNALRDHRWLLAVAALYSLAVLAEAVYCKVPPANLAHIFGYLLTSALLGLVFLSLLYIIAFIRFFSRASDAGALLVRWRLASARLDAVARAYFEGAAWPYACIAFLATLGGSFFFICKSLINVVNPYAGAEWDAVFAAWDRAVHFGFYPHEFVIPLVNALHLGRLVDFLYAIWLVIMLLVTTYNVFADDVIHRRLRFLWTHTLSWIFLGSIGATWLSSVGPLFYHDFFPDDPDIYAPILDNLDNMRSQGFVFAAKTRELLLGWARNDRIFDPNALSAMPSMHLAVGWMLVLYAREMARWIFIAALVFFGFVFTGAVYFGFHYAVDAYVSVVVVSLIWWAAGRRLDRRYPRGARLSEAA